jgi:hypothetical protein
MRTFMPGFDDMTSFAGAAASDAGLLGFDWRLYRSYYIASAVSSRNAASLYWVSMGIKIVTEELAIPVVG